MTDGSHDTLTTIDDPLDDLLDIAAQVSMAVDLHTQWTTALKMKIFECFEADEEIDFIARNSDISPVTVEAFRGEWLTTEAGRAHIKTAS